MKISRRTFLALGASVVVAACGDNSGSGSTTTGSTTAPTSPVTTANPTTLPTTTPPTTTAPTTTEAPAPTAPPASEYDGSKDPFTLGVASGDPLADSVILWTRLAPDPLNGGGLPDTPYLVHWDVALDEQFGQIVATDTVRAEPDVGHSIHVDAQHLESDTWFWYRFRTGSFTSPVGRTRTLPPPGTTPDSFVLATANCQNYEEGYYTAYDDLVAAKPDAVAFLGDYIYENAASTVGQNGVVRTHGMPEPTDEAGYRNRYALYKMDPALQAAHAACPWYVIWDDHEVENNYAGLQSEHPDVTPAQFAPRRNAAYQVWWEHQPVRLPAPRGIDDYKVYRQLWVGGLIELTMLDERQYRSDQACGDKALSLDPACPETFDTSRTMLGAEQEQWFAEAVGSTGAIWSAVLNEVILENLMLNGAVLNYDMWDGYPAARERFLQAVVANEVKNLVVLTGDIHFGGAGNLRGPGTDPKRPVIGTELITSAISSDALVPPGSPINAKLFPDVVDADLAHRGWTKHTVTPTTWTAEYRAVADVKQPGSPVSTWKTFTIEAGRPGVAREQ